MEYDIDALVKEMDFKAGELQKVSNGLMLTNYEIDVLNQYKINYSNCKSLKEILFEIEELIGDMDIVDEKLENISQSISERDYYQNTNK